MTEERRGLYRWWTGLQAQSLYIFFAGALFGSLVGLPDPFVPGVLCSIINLARHIESHGDNHA